MRLPLACLALTASLALAQNAPRLPVQGATFRPALPSLAVPFATIERPGGAITALHLNPLAVAEAASLDGAFRVDAFPLEPGLVVPLELERFEVMRESATIARGTAHGDEPLPFNPADVLLFRGHIPGNCHSTAFFSVSPWMTLGFVDLGASGKTYWISSPPATGDAPVAPARIAPAAGGAQGMTCGSPSLLLPSRPSPELEPQRGLRQIQVAIETDHEMFQIFNDENATAAYLLTVYAVNSVVFMRDINAYLDLTYMRIWPLPNEPFEADLSAFRSYWNANMGHVHRDTAQMFSGRGDKAGGVAWLPGLCGSFAYSFCGNAVGFWQDSFGEADIWLYDLHVTTHEFGHNFGSPHTDVLGIDKCNLYNEPARRGTIMSYCNQTISGGEAIIDLRFSTLEQNAMFATLPDMACVVFDCNRNGISDVIDLAAGSSSDANANGIPDECEDCNANGILDSIDIASGASLDLDANGVPDECQPDCNANGVPDPLDIALGTSQDTHLDNIPDECDHDCDGQEGSDYNQIVADMTLDKNRNRLLDDCEDCDHDGVTDLVALDGAGETWIASSTQSTIRRFTAVVGVLSTVSEPNHLDQPQDVLITKDRRVLVSSGATNSIVEFDHRGVYVRHLVSGVAELNFPTGMLLPGNGELLVASRNNNAILRFNASTGDYLGPLVGPASSNLSGPHGLAIGPSGDLFVSNANNRIQRFAYPSGAFLSTFASTGSLNNPKGILFLPDGHLLVANYGSDRLKRYHGSTGAYLGNWQITSIDFNGPWCLRLGPDGHVYVSQHVTGETHFTKPRISVFNARTGNWMRALVLGNDTGLTSPTGFDFLPVKGLDCNRNRRPDNCDIADGLSTDHNLNGIPDECESCYPDCEGDDDLDVFDFLCFQSTFAQQTPYADCENDGDHDIFDFLCFMNAFADGCSF